VGQATDLIERFNRVWNDPDLDAALSMLSDDVVFESTGPFPDGARHVGRDEIARAWAAIFADPASHFEIEELVELGDRVVQRFVYSWGDGHIRGIDLMTLRAGRIAQKLSYVKG
jgi:ketosteroid isomerase-like protein